MNQSEKVRRKITLKLTDNREIVPDSYVLIKSDTLQEAFKEIYDIGRRHGVKETRLKYAYGGKIK